MKILILLLVLLLPAVLIDSVVADEKTDRTVWSSIDQKEAVLKSNPIHQTCELPNKCDGIGGKFYSVKLSDGITMDEGSLVYPEITDKERQFGTKVSQERSKIG